MKSRRKADPLVFGFSFIEVNPFKYVETHITFCEPLNDFIDS